MKTKYGFETTIERSFLMSKIKSKNTTPEQLLRISLWRNGIRYRINNNNITGKPDILITKYKIAIFIDGEFWHGYNWEEKKKKIKTNRDYWIKKIENNIKRDSLNNIKLKQEGWKVLRFWERDIKKNLDNVIKVIIANFENKKAPLKE